MKNEYIFEIVFLFLKTHFFFHHKHIDNITNALKKVGLVHPSKALKNKGGMKYISFLLMVSSQTDTRSKIINYLLSVHKNSSWRKIEFFSSLRIGLKWALLAGMDWLIFDSSETDKKYSLESLCKPTRNKQEVQTRVSL